MTQRNLLVTTLALLAFSLPGSRVTAAEPAGYTLSCKEKLKAASPTDR